MTNPTTDPTAADLNKHAMGLANWTFAVIALCDHGKKPSFTTLAQVRGFFAVHLTVTTGLFTDTHSLTHLPTGGCIITDPSADDLKDLADELTEMGDWDFLDPSSAPKGAGKRVRAFRFGGSGGPA